MDELLRLLEKLHFDFEPDFTGQFRRFVRGSGSDENPNAWWIGRELPLDEGVLLVANFGDWRTGEKHEWHSKLTAQLTPEEKKKIDAAVASNRQANKQQREADEKRVAAYVAAELPKALKQGDHLYLQKKGLSGRGLFGCVLDVDNPSRLIVPLTDIQGVPWSVQIIQASGAKKFYPGGRTKGCFHLIPGKPGAEIYICEGLATGASIHVATGATVACAMTAGNLLAVAQAFRSKYPQARIIIAADNDHATPGNPGRTKAREAAKVTRSGVRAPMIPEAGARETDFNDLHQKTDLDEVRRQLEIDRADDEPAAEAQVYTDQVPAVIVPGPGVRATSPLDLERLTFIDAKGKPRMPTEQELVHAMLAHFGDRLLKQGRDFFRYDSTHWKHLSQEELDSFRVGFQRLAGPQAGVRLIDAAFKLLTYNVRPRPEGKEMFAPDDKAANFRNGTLWRVENEDYSERLEFRSHRREDYLTNVLPFDYLEGDTTRNAKLDDALTRIFNGDPDREEKRRAVCQMYGACLMPAYPRLFLIFGHSGTGKSTLIKLALALVSRENLATVSPDKFHGFDLASLAGKLVNFDTDIPVLTPIQDDIVKKIQDRTVMRIPRKFQDDLYAPIPAIHIFGANALPPSYEASLAHERRWTFIETKHVLPVEERAGEHYWAQILNHSPQGVLNFALEGLRDLVDSRGRFIQPDSGKLAMRRWHLEANPVAQFFDEMSAGGDLTPGTRCVLHENARIQPRRLWDIFGEWADQANIRVSFMTRHKFYAAVRGRGYSVVLIQGIEHFAGIGVEATGQGGPF